MTNKIFKSVLTCIVLVNFTGCGGGSGTSPANSTPEVSNTNNKTIYFESDFDADSTLRVNENGVAIFSLDNTSELVERIPFTILLAGEYELCLEDADNILDVELKDRLGNSVLKSAPVFPLDCVSVSLQADDYFLHLNFVSKITSNVIDPSTNVFAPVPFVRVDEKTELKDYVELTDWNDKLRAEIFTIDPASVYPPDYDVSIHPDYTSLTLRTCYSTPVSNNSFATFRVDANKLRLSFKADLSSGSEYLCSYRINFLELGLGDISPIGKSFAALLNRSIVSSSPRAGKQSVSISSDINIEFIGSIDRLPVGSAFSISPSIAGETTTSGQVLNFNPSGSFNPETTYDVTLAGLSKDGKPINDIKFSFKTEKVFDLNNLSQNSTVDSLSDAQLCALGVSEFCAEIYFPVITTLSAEIIAPSDKGSRYLEVTTSLQQPASGDIIIVYEMIDTSDQSNLVSDRFVIGFGETTGKIAWPIDDFDRAEHSVTMNITKISNALDSLQTTNTGTWTVYNGELYNTGVVVDTVDSGAPIINDMFLSGNISSNDLSLTVVLDSPAEEDVYIDFLFEGDCQWRSGVDTVCLDPGVVTISAGSDIKVVALKEPDASRLVIGSSLITVTVANTRNVNIGPGLQPATETLDGIAPPDPDPVLF